MSVAYASVGWTPHKRRYDQIVAGAVVAYVLIFVAVGLVLHRPPHELSPAVLAIRALGSAGIVLLHAILWIGPLCRLSPKFLPLLYNRRHLGVMTFLVGLLHAVLAAGWYHGFGNVNVLTSLFTSNTQVASISRFPFELLGVGALLILFLMAATSHDFWLKTLTPRVWKSLHMLVYGAYALLVMHVALGFLQSNRNPVLALALGLGVVVTVGLHVWTGLREVRRDQAPAPAPRADGFVDVASVDEIPLTRARVVCLPGQERIALYRHAEGLSAISNVCEHQMGPLGEGKIVDGCVTCPWHGYQYLPGTGCSPPPFTEKVATFEVRVEGRRVLVNPRPNPKGTPVPPAKETGEQGGAA